MVKEFDAIVIGGGATGAGVLWDLALRGIKAVLIEQHEPGYGTSGRNHGCVHSGGRYLVKDPKLALECYRENQILKNIAPEAIEDIGGLFVHIKDEDNDYMRRWVENAKKYNLPFEELSGREVRAIEPLITDKADRAFRTPSATVDPFDLIFMNIYSAVQKGARFMTESRVTGLLIRNGICGGVLVEDIRTKEQQEIRARAVINAAGPWVGRIAGMAGIDLDLTYGKGSLLAYSSRLVNHVVNRLRTPQDGDVLVPGKNICLFGTTDININNPDDTLASEEEVYSLLEMEKGMFPDLPGRRVLRTVTGVRPLYTPGQVGGAERDANRGHAVIDHGVQNGISGLFTIMGGKLTTYRLMAEQVVDEVAKYLGVNVPCRTAETSLDSLHLGKPKSVIEGKAICECEQVTEEELQTAAQFLDKVRPGAISRMTRIGFGPCQGTLCILRGALNLYKQGLLNYQECLAYIEESLNERWKGNCRVLWGDQVRQAELERGIYRGIYGPEGN